MSYVVPTEAYWNPGPVAYPDEPHEPVPGWGMRPNMTGPRLVGVGGLGGMSDETVYLGAPPAPLAIWKLPVEATAAQLQALWKAGGPVVDVPMLLLACKGGGSLPVVGVLVPVSDATCEGSPILTGMRLLLDGWAQKEAGSASHAQAAAYGYAQALLWRSFANVLDVGAFKVFPNGGVEAMIAAKRADGHAAQVGASHVLSRGATATIQGKPQTAWQASIKPKAAASREAAPSREQQAGDDGLPLGWIAVGALVLGGVAWFALKK